MRPPTSRREVSQRLKRVNTDLVLEEGINRVGDGHGVNQENRVDGEEVQDVHEHACLNSEVLLDDVGEVAFWLGAREHQAAKATVCPVGHWQCHDRHDEQRDDAADACVDGEEQDSRRRLRCQRVTASR